MSKTKPTTQKETDLGTRGNNNIQENFPDEIPLVISQELEILRYKIKDDLKKDYISRRNSILTVSGLVLTLVIALSGFAVNIFVANTQKALTDDLQHKIDSTLEETNKALSLRIDEEFKELNLRLQATENEIVAQALDIATDNALKLSNTARDLSDQLSGQLSVTYDQAVQQLGDTVNSIATEVEEDMLLNINVKADSLSQVLSNQFSSTQETVFGSISGQPTIFSYEPEFLLKQDSSLIIWQTIDLQGVNFKQDMTVYLVYLENYFVENDDIISYVRDGQPIPSTSIVSGNIGYSSFRVATSNFLSTETVEVTIPDFLTSELSIAEKEAQKQVFFVLEHKSTFSVFKAEFAKSAF